MEHAIDTMSVVSDLKKGGFSQQQAEALTEVFRDHVVDRIVTGDILKYELLRLQMRMTFTNTAILGVAVAFIKFF